MLAKPQGFPRKLGGCAGLDPRLRSAVSAGVGDGERGLRRGLRAPGVGVRPKWVLEYSPSNKRIRYFVSITYVRTGLWTAHKFCGGGKKVKPPKVRPTKIQVFTPEEIEQILWACDLYSTKGAYGAGNRKRMRAFILLLRYSGLRIRDVVTLEKARIDSEGRLFLHTSKSGTPVVLPLPAIVLTALSAVPNIGRHFFWSGNGLPKSCVSDWQRSLRKLFKLAGIKGNAHMFRHTLATELLTKGVPLETVAAILGNSAKIVEKHYAHFVKAWQLELENAVKKVWE